MDDLSFSASIEIAAPANRLYAMVSDVTRMGEWSPVTTSCSWEDGDDVRVGSRFLGQNDNGTRTWQTHCVVTTAEEGRAFAFEVGEAWVRWSYTFEELGDTTRATETWDLLEGGLSSFAERLGEGFDEWVIRMRTNAHTGIPATLAALKRVAEGT